MTSRTVTQAVADALAAREGAPRWLVEIVFDSGTARYWNGVGTLSALGQSWIGTGRLGAVEPVGEGSETVAQGLVLSLAVIPTAEQPDAPDAFLNIALGEEYQGRACTVYQAMLDPGTLALLADPFPRFKGYLDVVEDSEAPGAAALRVTVENRLVDLERPRKRTYTPEDQKAAWPDDTFFDEVAALQNREIVLE